MITDQEISTEEITQAHLRLDINDEIFAKMRHNIEGSGDIQETKKLMEEFRQNITNVQDWVADVEGDNKMPQLPVKLNTALIGENLVKKDLDPPPPTW